MPSNNTKTRGNNDVNYYVGIDWGKKRCGIAFADSETRIATGVGECKPADLAKEMVKLSSNMEISLVIVGFSDVLENERQNTLIRKVVERLEREGFSVKLEEELFSTKMAQKNLLQAGKRQVSMNDNVESARIILQGWLDKAV